MNRLTNLTLAALGTGVLCLATCACNSAGSHRSTNLQRARRAGAWRDDPAFHDFYQATDDASPSATRSTALARAAAARFTAFAIANRCRSRVADHSRPFPAR